MQLASLGEGRGGAHLTRRGFSLSGAEEGACTCAAQAHALRCCCYGWPSTSTREVRLAKHPMAALYCRPFHERFVVRPVHACVRTYLHVATEWQAPCPFNKHAACARCATLRGPPHAAELVTVPALSGRGRGARQHPGSKGLVLTRDLCAARPAAAPGP